MKVRSRRRTAAAKKPARTPADKHCGAMIESLETRRLLSGNWSTQDTQINLDQARSNYPTITGAGETVAIIDQGTDTQNPDFAGQVIASYNFDNNTADVTPYDNNAHGTGTTGQIAAQLHTYNGQLYEGVAPGVKIIALKANGTYETKEAMDWILAHKAQYNIVAVNYLDFTGTVDETQTLPEMQAINNAGIFMAGAVGNYGPQNAYQHYDHLIFNVGSVNSSDALSSFTPRGPNVDFVAPGENVVISWYSNGQHMDYTSSGTSWAGPQVTATGALIKQVSSAFTPTQIASIIHDSAHWVYDGYSNSSYAMLDVNAAIALAYQRAGKGGFTGSGPATTTAVTPPATTTTTTTKPTTTVTPPTTTTTTTTKPTTTVTTPTTTVTTPTPVKTTASVATPAATNTPFSGKPFSAGQTIEAENYDLGGEGIAYHDTTGSDDGSSPSYRSGGVDVGRTKARGGVGYVGWTHQGEWMDYTISAANTGTYAFNVRLASAGGGGAYHLELDGRNVSGPIAIPSTGSWSTFTTTTVSGISVSAGTHTLRVVMDLNGSGGFVANFDSFEFAQSKARSAVATRTVVVSSVPAVPSNFVVVSATTGSASLSWIDGSDDETSYSIERSTSLNGTYKLVSVIDSSKTTSRHTGTRSYTDTGLKAGTTYYYKVVASNAAGDSDAATVTATTAKRSK